MSRANKCIKDENGNDVWISRSNVVIPIVFKMDEETGDIFTLVEKRGSAVSHTGEWCCPCGYIDWDETLEEACHREVKEETGLDLDMDKIIFVNVDTNIHTKNQTIDHWYMCWTDEKDFDLSKVETKDEIIDLKWLKVAKVELKRKLLFKNLYMTIYKKSIKKCFGTWAFKTHQDKIIQMLKMTMKNQSRIIEVDE